MLNKMIDFCLNPKDGNILITKEKRFGPDSSEYMFLNEMEDEEWEEYFKLMESRRIEIYYSLVEDVFCVRPIGQ